MPEADNFKIEVGGKVYKDQKDGEYELLNAAIRNRKSEEYTLIGNYAGFNIFSFFNDGDSLKTRRESAAMIEASEGPIGTITHIINAI